MLHIYTTSAAPWCTVERAQRMSCAEEILHMHDIFRLTIIVVFDIRIVMKHTPRSTEDDMARYQVCATDGTMYYFNTRRIAAKVAKRLDAVGWQRVVSMWRGIRAV